MAVDHSISQELKHQKAEGSTFQVDSQYNITQKDFHPDVKKMDQDTWSKVKKDHQCFNPVLLKEKIQAKHRAMEKAVNLRYSKKYI